MDPNNYPKPNRSSNNQAHSSRLNQDFLLVAVEKKPVFGIKTTSRKNKHCKKILKRLKSHLSYGDQRLYTSRQFQEGSNKYEEFFCYSEEDNSDKQSSEDDDDNDADDIDDEYSSQSELGDKRKINSNIFDSPSSSTSSSISGSSSNKTFMKKIVSTRNQEASLFQNVSINIVDFLDQRNLGNVHHPLSLLPRIRKTPCFHTQSDFPLKHLLTNSILHEKPIKLENMNKIFTSQWLSDRQVIFGTKCNKLMVLDVQTNHFTQIPSLSPSTRSLPPDQQCGIHAIQMNPSRTLLATGGKNPNDLAVYQMPTLDPLCVGELAHEDWVFSLAWLDDQFIISGSRDTSLALWKIPEATDIVMNEPSSASVHVKNLTVDIQNMSLPSYSYINASSVKKCKSAQKIRDLVFNKRLEEIAVVSLNGYVHLWSADRFLQKFSRKLPFCLENVCITCHEDYGVYAVGSKSHTTIIDARTIQCVKKIPSKYSGYGIRSLNFFSSLLSIGTGQGTIMFYDMRAGKYLESNVNSARSATLKVSSGWTYPEEEILVDVYRQKYTPAIYTHCIDISSTRIFAAGGPLPITLCGNYMGLWH